MAKAYFDTCCSVAYINDFGKPAKWEIRYCPKHAAAPEMYEALNEVSDILRGDRFAGMYSTIKAQAIISRTLALADGEGGDDV